MVLVAWLMFSAGAGAEITLDGSLGDAGAIDGPDYEITADKGRQAGGNLFHSFSRFNIGAAESATFYGPDSVANIIGRVTGGDLSRIDGSIYSDIDGADLFLLNPAGFIFGPDAFLDVSGSFHISTADFLRMGKTAKFKSEPSMGENLSAAPPTAFGFDVGDTGRISVESDLQVGEVGFGESLSVVGGDVDISGSLYAPDGRVQVESRGPGAVASILTPESFDKSELPSRGGGTVSLTGTIDVSGDGKGRVFIRGGRFFSDGGDVWAETNWDSDGGLIDIRAGSVALAGGTFLSGDSYDFGGAADVYIAAADAVALSGVRDAGGPTRISTTTQYEEGEGAAGNISISSSRIELTDGAYLDASTFSYGDAGDVTLAAIEDVGLSGADGFGGAAGISTITHLEDFDAGSAGDIAISGTRISLGDGARIEASSNGDGFGGDVTLMADESVRLTGNDEEGRGSRIASSGESAFSQRAGDILIETDSLLLADGALIDSSAFGVGDGGDIVMRVGRSVAFSGYNGSGQGSGVIARSDSPTAAAGDIRIEDMSESGAISVDFQDGGWIGNTADGAGPGGNVTVDAGMGTLHFSGADADGYASRVYTTALDDGDAGDIVLKAGTEIGFSDGAGVTASTEGKGSAGRIEIAGGDLILSGGNPYGENKDGFGSGIYARTRTPDADPEEAAGGEISITVSSLEVRDGGLITSNTEGTGDGGSIDIQTGELKVYGDGAGLISEPPAESQLEWQENNPVRAASDYVSGIYASSEMTEGAAGDAGGVIIDADGIRLMDGGQVTTAAENAGGGAMEIAIDDTLFMLNGKITTSVQFGADDGGDITIREPRFVILNHSEIIAQAYEGRGGNILIVTDQFLKSADSIVDASSELGIDGNIEIVSPEADLSKVLTVLPTDYLDAAQWMETPCEARSGEEISRFVITGRDGAPPPCDGVLGSPVWP